MVDNWQIVASFVAVMDNIGALSVVVVNNIDPQQ